MTIELFTENSYIKKCTSEISSLDERFVVFEQTIFYPGGGGQPCDRGYIKQGDQIYKVLKVKKEEGEIIHEIDRPLQGTKQAITMEIDWSWRFQNMRYHTLLHVIAGYLYKNYNALTTSSQIEEDYARLELAFSPEIIEELSFEDLEQSLKELLVKPHNVQINRIDREEAQQKDGIIKTMINLLPPSLNEIRIVRIDDIDEQACSGTHVNNTFEIGDFSILKIQAKGAMKRRIKVQLN
jgi:misacylated tRNA(Ala) deacylase